MKDFWRKSFKIYMNFEKKGIMILRQNIIQKLFFKKVFELN